MPANSNSVELPSRVRPARDRRRGKRAGGKGDGNFQAPPAKPNPGAASGPVRTFQPPQRALSSGGGASAGKKGQDASYLLNFRAPERRQESRAALPLRRSGRGVQRFDKGRFLAANYRFVVANDVDCSVLLADPDRSPEWDSIAEVHVAEVGQYQCPICLEQPQAARMTQCGHVYCWPCLQRLWAVAGRPFAPCPICQNIVTASHGASKPAVVHVQTRVANADKVEFHLMRREKGTITVQRASSLSPAQLAAPAHAHAAALPMTHPDCMFGKVSVAGPGSGIRERERAELNEMLELFISAGEQEMVPHVQACLRALDAHPSSAAPAAENQADTPPEDPQTEAEVSPAAAEGGVGGGGGLAGLVGAEPFSPKPSTPSGERELRRSWSRSEVYVKGEMHYTGMSDDDDHWDDDDDDHKDDDDDEHDDGQEECRHDDEEQPKEEEEAGGGEGRKGGKGEESRGREGVDGVYFFYQAADGQALFMHPLSVRALVEEHGGYLGLPHVVTGAVVDMERLTQSEELRKRHRCFEYLALSADMTLAEIDIAPLVSRETLRHFEPKLRERREARNKAQRREAQRAAKAEREERRQRDQRLPAPPSDLLEGPTLLAAMAAAQGELSEDQLNALLTDALSPTLPGTSPASPPVPDSAVRWKEMLSKPRPSPGAPSEPGPADFPALGEAAFPSLAEAAGTPPPTKAGAGWGGRGAEPERQQSLTPPARGGTWGGRGGKAVSPATPVRQGVAAAGKTAAGGKGGVGIGGYSWKKEVEEEERYAGEVFEMEEEEISEEERRRRMKEATDRAWENALASAAGGEDGAGAGGGGGSGKKGRKQKTVLLAWG